MTLFGLGSWQMSLAEMRSRWSRWALIQVLLRRGHMMGPHPRSTRESPQTSSSRKRQGRAAPYRLQRECALSLRPAGLWQDPSVLFVPACDASTAVQQRLGIITLAQASLSRGGPEARRGSMTWPKSHSNRGRTGVKLRHLAWTGSWWSGWGPWSSCQPSPSP